MDTSTQVKNGLSKAKQKTDEAFDAAEEKVDVVETALQERVEQARDLVEELRDRAELAFHERPYLLPVATGALGLGVGVLIGSKLSRVLVMTAAGALLSETVRTQLFRLSRDLIKNLGEGEEQAAAEEEDVEPSEASSAAV